MSFHKIIGSDVGSALLFQLNEKKGLLMCEQKYSKILVMLHTIILNTFFEKKQNILLSRFKSNCSVFIAVQLKVSALA